MQKSLQSFQSLEHCEKSSERYSIGLSLEKRAETAGRQKRRKEKTDSELF